VTLENDRAIETRALDLLAIDDHRPGGGIVETGQNIEHRGLAAAGMTDDADEFAAAHRQPQIGEYAW
jgi:hypothetical protein